MSRPYGPNPSAPLPCTAGPRPYAPGNGTVDLDYCALMCALLGDSGAPRWLSEGENGVRSAGQRSLKSSICPSRPGRAHPRRAESRRIIFSGKEKKRMPLEFKEGFVRPNLMQKSFMLRENPFRISAIYNPDNPGTYEPKMYGKQYDEFYEKFFIQPLNRGRNKQVIGAIWSSQTATDWRGFGKSMLMSEESKKLCSDFGASMLEEARSRRRRYRGANPVLAGYCTFDQAKDVKTFGSALLDAVAFMLEQPHGDWTVHQELRNRISEDKDAEEGYEGEAVRRALHEQVTYVCHA